MDGIFQEHNRRTTRPACTEQINEVRITTIQNVFWTYNTPDTK